ICGPWYDPEKEAAFMHSTKTQTDDIRIPDSTWRVEIVFDSTSKNDINRITEGTTLVAINVPNTSTCYSDARSEGYSEKTSWQHYITTVDEIEELTGLDFFANLPDEVEDVLESRRYVP
ncbi:MAG: DNA/RNA non-specific endonuclease, partial [Treponema sp.]|nr:DNA/RNA non-specific endonuclease [Treponema sp.]